MSITSVNETFKNRAPVENLQGRTYKRTFDVVTSVATDGGYEIFNNADIPNPGDKHNKDAQATCQTVTPQLKTESKDGTFWLVVCDYDTFNKVNNSETDRSADPVNEPPVITYGYIQYARVMDQAYPDAVTAGGTPTEAVLASNKMPFDPPVTIEMSNRVIRIVRNESRTDYSPNELEAYNNTINLTKINVAGVILEIGQGRIRNIPAELLYKKSGAVYYRVTYEIEVDRRTHIKKLLDRGFYELDASTGAYTAIKDEDGDLVTEPVLLDGSGKKVSNPATATPTFKDRRFFEYKNWYSLRLPIDDAKRQTADIGGIL